MHPASSLLLMVCFGLTVVNGLVVPSGLLDVRADRCGSDPCQGITHTNASYVCGDPRLGPKKLPTKLPIDSIVTRQTYDRLGGLCAAAFIAKWWNSTANSWIYPPDDGFQLNTAGSPIDGNQTLVPGQLLDRFGSEYGTFLAPTDAPYFQRSLPPQNLDTPVGDPSYPYNYHVYRVEKSFEVLSGPIAPWFGQPGQGTQYASSMSVMALLEGGYISRVALNKDRPA